MQVSERKRKREREKKRKREREREGVDRNGKIDKLTFTNKIMCKRFDLILAY